MAMTKASILLQFIRILAPIPRSMSRYGIIAFIWLNTLWFTAAVLVSSLQCIPVAKLWNPDLQGSCSNYPIYMIVMGIFNSVVDITMLTIPIVWIWQLNMSSRRKVGVSAVFMIGAL